MGLMKDTQFVIKNGVVQQPFIPKDGLELYYDVTGKKNSDAHKDKLLDLSGNGRDGVLSNFAFEGVSGYRGTTEGGLLLDDVDDKIVRPAIDGIEYTSASRNLFDLNYYSNQSNYYASSSYKTINTNLDKTIPTFYIRAFLKDGKTPIAGMYMTIVMGIGTNGDPNFLNKGSKHFISEGNPNYISVLTHTALPTDDVSLRISYYPKNLSITDILNSYDIVLSTKDVPIDSYTPYIPLPIMTYQMNGNILSFEKDGTVKRTTKDANGNEVVVSRKGINLVRNGNFANGKSYWGGSYTSIPSDSELSIVNSSTSRVYIQTNIDTGIDDKIYYSFLGKTDSINGTVYAFGKTSALGSNTTLGYPSIKDSVDFVKCEGIVPTNSNVMYLGFISVVPSKSSIKNIQLINLTQAYGAGNEPDLTYIQAHPEEFAWTPNPNDLIETAEIKNNLVGDLENLQGNDFEQHEDGVITYTNEAEEGSVVRVDIDGISDQPLRFRNATGEQVVITEHDQVDTDAIKKIEFQGNSVQLADKYREVSGTSVTIAPELHDKSVADKLVIGGNTYQYTESSNVVTDGLQMWLSGRNFSNSPATTVWKDLTGVNNGTASGFEYRTNVYADVVSNFIGKVAGSVVENANIMKYAPSGNCSSLKLPTDLALQETNNEAGYDKIAVLNSVSATSQRSTVGEIPQHLFSFNVIKVFEKQHGNIPSTDQTTAGKVAWLKDNLSDISAKWYGYGSCPSGNKASIYIFSNDWYKNAAGWDVFTSSPSLITASTSNFNAYIQADGFVHYLVCTDASDGVTASTVYTDYVSLTLTTSGASGSDGAGGVNFDGVDDYVTIPYKTTEATMSQALTLETKFSIKTIPVGKENNIIDKNGFSNYRLGISLGGFIHTTAQIKKSDGVPYYIDDYGPKKFYPIIGTTYHATYTISIPNKVIKLYINGSLFGQISLNSISSEIFLTPGVNTLVGKMIGNNYFNGDIYMTRIYNRALSDAEILQNYNAGLAIPIPNIAMPQEVKHVNSGSKVLVHGKNLFNPLDSNIRNAGFNTNKTYIYSPLSESRVVSKTADAIVYNCTGNYNGVGIYKKLKPNTSYVFSATQSGGSDKMWVSYTTYNNEADISLISKAINFGGSTNMAYLTTGESDVHVVFALTAFVVNETITATNIQIEEGVVKTAYEPFKGYQETTIPVTLKSIG